jgi:hypothetical protein
MLAQCVEIDVIDVPGEAGQQIGETQNRSLGGIEELFVSSRAGFPQRCDLFIGAATPLRRSGMRTRSILTAVEDRRA